MIGTVAESQMAAIGNQKREHLGEDGLIEKEVRMALVMIGITIAVGSVAWGYFSNGGLLAGIGTIMGAGLIALSGIPWIEIPD